MDNNQRIGAAVGIGIGGVAAGTVAAAWLTDPTIAHPRLFRSDLIKADTYLRSPTRTIELNQAYDRANPANMLDVIVATHGSPADSAGARQRIEGGKSSSPLVVGNEHTVENANSNREGLVAIRASRDPHSFDANDLGEGKITPFPRAKRAEARHVIADLTARGAAAGGAVSTADDALESARRFLAAGSPDPVIALQREVTHAGDSGWDSFGDKSVSVRATGIAGQPVRTPAEGSYYLQRGDWFVPVKTDYQASELTRGTLVGPGIHREAAFGSLPDALSAITRGNTPLTRSYRSLATALVVAPLAAAAVGAGIVLQPVLTQK